MILFLALTSNYGFAGNPLPVKQFINNTDWNFIENKGQVADSEIKYYGHQGGVYLSCKPGMISFVFTKVEKESEQISEATSQPSGFPLTKGAAGFGHEKNQPSKVTTSRPDLILINANPSAKIIASDQQEYYENYYTTGDADHGIINVHTYKTITYKDIYPYIDLILHSREEGMKYEFVVLPGGKVSDIQMEWNGLEGIKKLKNSGFEYSLALGKIDESKPVSFQDGSYVKSEFVKNDNQISFRIGKYDKSKTLVIDPTILWGTYFGGKLSDAGNAVAIDKSGGVYITGYTRSINAIATSGAYQTSNIGGGSKFGGGLHFLQNLTNPGQFYGLLISEEVGLKLVMVLLLMLLGMFI